jgi:hypothetical protein
VVCARQLHAMFCIFFTVARFNFFFMGLIFVCAFGYFFFILVFRVPHPIMDVAPNTNSIAVPRINAVAFIVFQSVFPFFASFFT